MGTEATTYLRVIPRRKDRHGISSASHAVLTGEGRVSIFVRNGQQVDWKPFAWTMASMFCGGAAAGIVSPDHFRAHVVVLTCLSIFCGITALRFK